MKKKNPQNLLLLSILVIFAIMVCVTIGLVRKNTTDIKTVVSDGFYSLRSAPEAGLRSGIYSVAEDTEEAVSKKADQNATVLIIIQAASIGVMAAIVLLLVRNFRKMQDTLFKMANNDVLTGLANRQYLMSYLPQIAEAAVKKDAPFALLLIDLDNFKQVNDNAGHNAGDELLRHIAANLNDASVFEDSKSFRPDAGMLSVSARIGGDEFVQIIHNIRTDEEAARAAGRVLESFDAHISREYVEKYQVGLSIGVARFPFHTDNYSELIKFADLAMYHAKRGGKHNYKIYDDTMIQPERVELEHTGAERRQNRR